MFRSQGCTSRSRCLDIMKCSYLIQFVSCDLGDGACNQLPGMDWNDLDYVLRTDQDAVLLTSKHESNSQENKNPEQEEKNEILKEIKQEDCERLIHCKKNEIDLSFYQTEFQDVAQDIVEVKNEITIEEHEIDLGNSSDGGSLQNSEELKLNKYQCGECGKCFTRRSYLGTHARTHTGEKPYICGVCNRGFGQRIHLTKHERIHSGEKPFDCKECGKRFIRRGYLIKHLRTHTGERPYHCFHCSKSFSQRNHLTKHARTHKEKQN